MDSQPRPTGLAGVERQCVVEQSLKRPASGEVNANAASGLADAGADFEQLGTQSFDLGRAPGLRQMMTEEVDQVVGGSVQQQTEGVGQEAMTTQAVGTEAIFEFLDAVLALAAVVVKSENRRGATRAVGDDEAQVGSGSGVFGGPAAGAVVNAGKATLRHLSTAIAQL
jgi:hypothetical protein